MCDLLLQNYQVDWEAILARSPEPFIQSVSPWLYPPAARETLQNSPSGQGLTADSARVEDPLADMSTPSMDGIGNGNMPGTSKAAPTDTVYEAKAVPTTAGSDSTSKSGKGAAPPKLPDVATLLDTMRKRLEALNGPTLPRI